MNGPHACIHACMTSVRSIYQLACHVKWPKNLASASDIDDEFWSIQPLACYIFSLQPTPSALTSTHWYHHTCSRHTWCDAWWCRLFNAMYYHKAFYVWPCRPNSKTVFFVLASACDLANVLTLVTDFLASLIEVHDPCPSLKFWVLLSQDKIHASI